MLCEHARKATTVVPKRYRHLSKVPKRCPARTVGHPKVIKGARHVPGPIRELTSLILHDHGPCTAPSPGPKPRATGLSSSIQLINSL